jgi:hypothetical protein
MTAVFVSRSHITFLDNLLPIHGQRRAPIERSASLRTFRSIEVKAKIDDHVVQSPCEDHSTANVIAPVAGY